MLLPAALLRSKSSRTSRNVAMPADHADGARARTSPAPPAEPSRSARRRYPALSEFTILAYVDLVRCGVFGGTAHGYTPANASTRTSRTGPLGVRRQRFGFSLHKVQTFHGNPG